MVDKTRVRIRVQNLCFNLSQMVIYKQLNIFVKSICIPSIAILLQTFIYIQVYNARFNSNNLRATYNRNTITFEKEKHRADK